MNTAIQEFYTTFFFLSKIETIVLKVLTHWDVISFNVQKLSNEFKDGESDLFNILNMGEELSIDSQLSEDVRNTVRQDISSLRENHSNIADLLKSQREK